MEFFCNMFGIFIGIAFMVAIIVGLTIGIRVNFFSKDKTKIKLTEELFESTGYNQEYILLCKHEGVYRVHTTGNTLFEVEASVKKVTDNVRNKFHK